MSNTVEKWRISSRTFDRYWKKANEAYSEAQKQIKESVIKDDTIKALEAEKRAIMTAMERKEYLTKIVKGEILIPDVELKYDSQNGYWAEKKVMRMANHQVRIKCISSDNFH